MIEEKEKERMEKLNEFESYLLGMKQYNQEIDDLVDESQSREELERQVMDNNYMREKIEERRMNESMQSDRSSKPVKAIAFPKATKPNLTGSGPVKPVVQPNARDFYKPPIGASSSDKVAIRNEEPENIDSIEMRIAKQLEAFHKFKNEALKE